MSSSSRSEAILSRLTTPGLLIVVAVLFAGRAGAPRIAPTRPAADSHGSARSKGKIETLLTQDPLEAVRAVDSRKKPRAGDSSPSARLALELGRVERELVHVSPAAGAAATTCPVDGCADCLADALASEVRGRGRVLLLLEHLRGGDAAEDRERRVRSRQASLYALLQHGFQPDDVHALRYFVEKDGEHTHAYEWFRRDPRAGGTVSIYASVLLIWLDEAGDEGKPLESLLRIVDRITRAETMPDVRVVGPTSTGEMLELLSDGSDRLNACSEHIELHSPFATAQTRFEDALKEFEDRVRSRGANFSICRTIGSDLDLARVLVAELAERIPELMTLDSGTGIEGAIVRSGSCLPRGFGPKDEAEKPWVNVAVVKEANTPYGREWLKSLEDARQELFPACSPVGRRLRFHSFDFVSPIDGPRPAAVDGDDSLDLDYPVGAQQIDYVRRLERRLDAWAEGASATFDAIGIFCTDVYDALMIVEALRPRFPDALFFTTDLDARYLHRRHVPFTRNMLVASHFDLVPEDEEPGQEAAASHASAHTRPEFRDTYQTSLFLALGGILNGKAGASAEPASPSWRLHEIGSTRAIALNAPRRADQVVGEPDLSRIVEAASSVAAPLHAVFAGIEEGWAYVRKRTEALAGSPDDPPAEGSGNEENGATKNEPMRTANPRAVYYFWATLSAIVIVGLFAFLVRSSRSESKHMPWGIPALVFLLWIAVSVWILDRASTSPFAQEPLIFDEGVSVWPSILLRLAIFLYCLVGIGTLRSHLIQATEKLRLEHSLFGGDREVPSRWKVCRWLVGPGRAEHLPLDGVWKRAEAWAESLWVWPRLVFYALAILGIGIPFYRLSAPMFVPARGEFAYVVERWSLIASLIGFFMLFAFVLETTFLAVRLITQITSREATGLPILLIHRYARILRRARQADESPISIGTLDYKLRLDLVRDVTRIVENLVYLPMVAVCLIIVARSSMLDSWSWPTVLVATLVVFFALLLTCVIVLRRVAGRAQARALQYVEKERLRHVNHEIERRRLDVVREQLRELQGGAFSPLYEHPLVHTALTVVGTTLAMDHDLLGGLFGRS